MGVTGDFAKLANLTTALKTLDASDPRVAAKAAVKVAPPLAGFISAQFASGTDPFGDPWRALKGVTLRKGRHPPPLTDTGAARAALLVLPQNTRDRIRLPNYLRYHLRSRPVLPMRGEQWPQHWHDAVRRYAEESIRELMSGVK